MPTNIINKLLLQLAEAWDGWGMLLYVVITLTISAVLSALIGLERYRKGENAGIRTHALLALGCCFLMIVSIWALRIIPNLVDTAKYDVSRIPAAVISGVGFLGAGVIIKDRFTVKGLSTATTLWICSGIGLATGAGFVLEAIIATVITMLVVFVRNRIIIGIDRNAPHVVITAIPGYPVIEAINNVCNKNGLNLKNTEITALDNNVLEVRAYFPYHINKHLLQYFVIEMKKIDEVKYANIVMKNNAENYDQGPHES